MLIKKKIQVPSFAMFLFHLTKTKQCMCIMQETDRNVSEDTEKDAHQTVHSGQLWKRQTHFCGFLCSVLCVYVLPMSCFTA